MTQAEKLYETMLTQGVSNKDIIKIAKELADIATIKEKNTIYSDEENDIKNERILVLYNRGVNYSDISKLMEMTTAEVYARLEHIGVARGLKTKIDRILQVIKIHELLSGWHSILDITKIMGIDRQLIISKWQRYRNKTEWYDKFKGKTRVEINRMLVEEMKKNAK